MMLTYFMISNVLHRTTPCSKEDVSYRATGASFLQFDLIIELTRKFHITKDGPSKIYAQFAKMILLKLCLLD